MNFDLRKRHKLPANGHRLALDAFPEWLFVPIMAVRDDDPTGRMRYWAFQEQVWEPLDHRGELTNVWRWADRAGRIRHQQQNRYVFQELLR